MRAQLPVLLLFTIEAYHNHITNTLINSEIHIQNGRDVKKNLMLSSQVEKVQNSMQVF